MQSQKRFVVKEKERQRFLTKQEIAHEKIASDLYELCGVAVPKTYVTVRKLEDGSEIYGLASKFEEGYCDLQHYLNASAPKIEEMDASRDRKTSLGHYADKIEQLNIEDLNKALAASAYLYDEDVIGRDFCNVGLIEKQEGGHRLVKIDTGNAILLDNEHDDAYGESFSEGADNPYILDQYGFDGLGNEFNHRFIDVFQVVKEEDKVLAIKAIVEIDESRLRKVIFNQQLIAAGLVTEKECQAIFNTLLRRKKILAKVYQTKLSSCLNNEKSVEQTKYKYEQKKTIIRFSTLADTGEQITHGNAAPSIFFKPKAQSIDLEIWEASLAYFKSYEDVQTWSNSRQNTISDILKVAEQVDINNITDVNHFLIYLYQHYLTLRKQAPKSQVCGIMEKSLIKLLDLYIPSSAPAAIKFEEIKRVMEKKCLWSAGQLVEGDQVDKNQIVFHLYRFIHQTESSVSYKFSHGFLKKHFLQLKEDLAHARSILKAINRDEAISDVLPHSKELRSILKLLKHSEPVERRTLESKA